MYSFFLYYFPTEISFFSFQIQKKRKNENKKKRYSEHEALQRTLEETFKTQPVFA